MLYQAAAVLLDREELSRAGIELELAWQRRDKAVASEIITRWRSRVDRALVEGDWNMPEADPGLFAVDDLPQPDDPSASPTTILICVGAGAVAYRKGVSANNSRRGAQALRWWMLAAATGHAIAAFDLAIEARSRGDLDNALRWWRQAAANGHQESAQILSILALAGVATAAHSQGIPLDTATPYEAERDDG